jgi:hypothetical protein
MIATGDKYLNRTCAECQTFNWSDDGIEGIGNNSRKRYRSLQAVLDAGARPSKRIPLTILPCFECPKVPDNAPAKHVRYAKEITDQSWETIAHFDECDAVNQFPDDRIVRHNAAIIRRIRADAQRAEHGKGMAYLFSILTLGAGGK